MHVRVLNSEGGSSPLELSPSEGEGSDEGGDEEEDDLEYNPHGRVL